MKTFLFWPKVAEIFANFDSLSVNVRYAQRDHFPHITLESEHGTQCDAISTVGTGTGTCCLGLCKKNLFCYRYLKIILSCQVNRISRISPHDCGKNQNFVPISWDESRAWAISNIFMKKSRV